MFSTLRHPHADGLWSQVAALQSDPRAHKMDLVVGVYRDGSGRSPVMNAVTLAEQSLATRAGSKEYRGMRGNARFNESITDLILGSSPARARAATLQTVAGTGALHVLAELIAATRPGARILVGTPSYVNHVPIFRLAGLDVRPYPFLGADGTPSMAAMLDAIDAAVEGDVFLIQGCCHNPSGSHVTREDWVALTEAVVSKGLIPFVDLAYYGLGEGLDADLEASRQLLSAVPEAVIAVSCSKAFSLYSERTGAAIVITDERHRAAVLATLETIARVEYSQPPDHGAAIVAEILVSPVLRPLWTEELDQMRARLESIRTRCLAELPAQIRSQPHWGAVAEHRGMFSTLPLDESQMRALRTEFGIYGTDSGRINVAGVLEADIGRLADAIATVSSSTRPRRSVSPV